MEETVEPSYLPKDVNLKTRLLVTNYSIRATIALRAIVARQSTRQFTQRDTHNQNVCIVTMRAGDG